MNDVKPIIEQLKAREPLPPLFPTRVWDANLSKEIQQLSQADGAVRSGLLLWNDDLDASHTISQNIHSATGSFWHAIMHRREGDAGNSKYWWHRTGAHPAFDAIQQAALTVLQGETSASAQAFAEQIRKAKTWLPEKFVDACVAVQRNGESWPLRVQVAEMETLVNWCLENAET